MSNKIRKMLHNQKGFTLIELMTVLIILGIILGIGVPKYLKIQERAEYDADIKTIENIAKAAEVYAAQMNDFSNVKIKGVLITKGIIDGNIVLNRVKGAKNKAGDTLEKMLATTDESFEFKEDTGEVKNLDAIITALIGEDPYK